MRSSTVLALAFGTLAAASPMKLKKKTYDYEWITDIVWVTVTEGDLPATPAPAAPTVVVSSPVYVAPTQDSNAAASSTAPVVVSTTTTAAAAPTTPTEAPVVVETTPTTAAVPTSTVEPVAAEAVSSTTSVAAVSSTTAAAAASSPTDFDSAALYHHNIHRANHSASDVTYDSTLAGYAQTLADRCSNAHDVTIGGGGYGQNIASYGSSGDSTLAIDTLIAAVISNMWYDGEVALYDNLYGQANPTENFEGWGHFSQVVWKSTTTIGCAATLCAPGTIFDGLSTWFAVCNYATAGNVAGEYADNVLPPTEGASSSVFVDI